MAGIVRSRRGLARGLSGGQAAVVLGVIVAVGVLLPFIASGYVIGLMAMFVPLVMLAIAIDLLWGENHLVSFGHGAFFAGGAYIAGLILRGQTGNVADANTNLLSGGGGASGLGHLLMTLHGVELAGVPLLGLVIAPLACAVVGLLIGAAVFRIGSPEVYVPLVTLGFGVIAALALNDVSELGSSNGLSSVPGYTQGTSLGQSGEYFFGVAFVLLTYVGYWLFRRSRAGTRWRAIGDDPLRMEALGHNVYRVRTFGFAASAALAGLAGAVYVGAAGYIGPTSAGVTFSTQALIWAAVGGVGTLLGPLVGVLFIKWGEYLLSSVLGLADSWQLFLGIVLMVVVIVVPEGMTGLPRRLRSGLRRRERMTPVPRTPPAMPSGEA